MGEPQASTELHCGWIQNRPGGLVGGLGTNCSEVVGRSVDKSQHHPNYPRWCCGRCRKCSLQEEPSFHIVCECNALAGIRKRVLVQAYPDAVNIRDSELRLSVSCCQLTGHRRPMNLGSVIPGLQVLHHK